MNIIEIVISTIIGILTSYLMWWFTYKFLVPKITFSESISRLNTDENPSGKKYRFKLENSGSRNIIDLQVLVKLRIKGLRKNHSNNWEVIYIPTSTLDYKNVAIVKPTSKKGLRVVLEIKTYECDYFQKPLFSDEIRTLSNNKSITLDDVLSIGKEAEFQILVFCYDEFSGARKFFESKKYTADDIHNKQFDSNGLSLK